MMNKLEDEDHSPISDIQQDTTRSLQKGDRLYIKRSGHLIDCTTVSRINQKSVTLANNDRLEIPFRDGNKAIGAGSYPSSRLYFFPTPQLDAQFEMIQLRREWLSLHSTVVAHHLTAFELTQLVQAYQAVLTSLTTR